MATDTGLPVAAGQPPRPEADQVPASSLSVRPDEGIGRRLRVFAGVREEILDWVPAERPRYTRLGLIVLNTGGMAGLSMLVGLGSVVDVPWVFVLPVALMWGYMIVSLDGWLITSTHGMLTQRLWIFLVRLALSVLIGLFIAEPLVLWFFRPAIRTEIAHMRADDAAEQEGRWVRCNPPSGEAPAGCKGFLLNLKDSPAAVQAELTRAQSERNALQGQLNALNRQLAGRQHLARRECNGDGGAGLSGRSGEGPNCRQDRREAEQFRATNRMADKHATLLAYDRRIDGLNQQLKQRGQDYRLEIKTEIGNRMAEWRRDRDRPGLLDEARALSRLSDKSMFVTFEHMLLRLLLIAIDCLPIAAKWLSGTTAYDVLHARQIEMDKRLHEAHLRLHERRDSSRYELQRKRADYDHHATTEEIEEAYRATRARRETGIDAEVQAMAAQLRRQG